VRFQVYFVLVVVTVAIGMLVLIPRSVRLSTQEQRVEVLNGEVAALEAEIERFEKENERLLKDPEPTERFARERMGWRREGEVIFK
jgi:cell division protein FtsB